MGSLEGGESALRLDDGLFYATLEDDYCLPVPSHSPELERLNICHEIYKTMTGGLLPQCVLDYLTEDDEEKTILDVGSGTGIWAQEMAQEYNHVEVYGIDLVDPPLAHLPANATFTISNLLLGIDVNNDTYDIVHIRDIALGVRDYPSLLEECVRVLKPGGYLVVQEMEWLVDFLDERNAEETCPVMWKQKLHTAIEERGLDPLLGYTLERYFSDVQGLSGTESQRYCVPIAPGSDDPTDDYLGRLSSETWELFGQSGRILFEDNGTFDSQDLSEGGLDELQNQDLFWFFDVCVGRKDGA